MSSQLIHDFSMIYSLNDMFFVIKNQKAFYIEKTIGESATYQMPLEKFRAFDERYIRCLSLSQYKRGRSVESLLYVTPNDRIHAMKGYLSKVGMSAREDLDSQYKLLSNYSLSYTDKAKYLLLRNGVMLHLSKEGMLEHVDFMLGGIYEYALISKLIDVKADATLCSSKQFFVCLNEDRELLVGYIGDLISAETLRLTPTNVCLAPDERLLGVVMRQNWMCYVWTTKGIYILKHYKTVQSKYYVIAIKKGIFCVAYDERSGLPIIWEFNIYKGDIQTVRRFEGYNLPFTPHICLEHEKLSSKAPYHYPCDDISLSMASTGAASQVWCAVLEGRANGKPFTLCFVKKR